VEFTFSAVLSVVWCYWLGIGKGIQCVKIPLHQSKKVSLEIFEWSLANSVNLENDHWEWTPVIFAGLVPFPMSKQQWTERLKGYLYEHFLLPVFYVRHWWRTDFNNVSDHLILLSLWRRICWSTKMTLSDGGVADLPYSVNHILRGIAKCTQICCVTLK